MATMKKMVAKKAPKKYAMGGSMTTTTETTKPSKVMVSKKTTVKVTPKKKTNNDVQMYKGPKGEILSGEGFDAKDQNYNMLKKNGGKVIKKAKAGTSLGMKSVNAGYDNNSGVTRADFVSIGKGKAKNGTKMKNGGMHKMPGGKMMKNSAMKSGGKMAKCKYGCN